MKALLLLPAAWLYLLLPACRAFDQSHNDSLEVKMDKVFQRYNNPKGPGCAVAVIRNGAVTFKKGYGMANLEYDIPITPATTFDIASVSKQFAGLAISMLMQQGKISAVDDIRKYLPEVPKFGKTITVGHLLHHTSGLRDWPQTLNAAGWRWDEVFSFNDIMRMVRYQQDLDFEPGEEHSYSNTGYNLLAAIVAKVTGKSFREWTDEHIFKPQGMNASHFLDDHRTIVKNLAYSYSPADGGFLKVPGGLTAYGSSSLFTSVDDLCKWAINLEKSISSKDPVYMRMLEEGTLNNGEKVHYGYGLGLGKFRGLRSIAHTGGWLGYRTILSILPDERFAVIILSNAADFDVEKYFADVTALFLKDKLKEEEQAPVNPQELRDRPAVKIDTSLALQYTGTYLLGPGWAVTLTLENGRLMTQANGEDKFSLQPRSDSSFWVDGYGSAMTFAKDSTGSYNLLKYRSILARRIKPWAPDTARLHEYAGTYYSPELRTEYMIDMTNGRLVLHHMRLGDMDVKPDPTAEDRFGIPSGLLRFERNDQRKVTGLFLSGGRIRNIRFIRR